jgi:hypothetical protein
MFVMQKVIDDFATEKISFIVHPYVCSLFLVAVVVGRTKKMMYPMPSRYDEETVDCYKYERML